MNAYGRLRAPLLQARGASIRNKLEGLPTRRWGSHFFCPSSPLRIVGPKGDTAHWAPFPARRLAAGGMAAPEDPFKGTSVREFSGHKKKARGGGGEPPHDCPRPPASPPPPHPTPPPRHASALRFRERGCFAACSSTSSRPENLPFYVPSFGRRNGSPGRPTGAAWHRRGPTNPRACGTSRGTHTCVPSPFAVREVVVAAGVPSPARAPTPGGSPRAPSPGLVTTHMIFLPAHAPSPFPRSQGKELELRGHNDTVDKLCWNPMNSDQLATISADRTVRPATMPVSPFFFPLVCSFL